MRNGQHALQIAVFVNELPFDHQPHLSYHTDSDLRVEQETSRTLSDAVLNSPSMRPISQQLDLNTERLLAILIYIQTHLDESLALEELAERAGLSTFHFHRVFRVAIGETVEQYVERMRLEQAAYQLKLRDNTIIDVSFGLGYNTQNIHPCLSSPFWRHAAAISPVESCRDLRYRCSNWRYSTAATSQSCRLAL